MDVLKNLAAVLTIVFTLLFLVLMAELIYVLWQRRRFRKQNVSGSEDSQMSEATFYLPSKELLYFFCWKNRSSQVEPAATPPALMDVSRDSEAAEDDDDDDLEKLQAVYVSSRLLYTIKEEEKEGRDSISEYSAESEPKSPWTLRDPLAAKALNEAALDAVDEVEAETETPYYTPSPSPCREESVTPAEGGAVGKEETETVTDFVSILIKDELSLVGNITSLTK